MAVTAAEIQAKFTSVGADGVEGDLDRLGDKTSNVGDRFISAGKKATAFATVPILGAFGKWTMAASDNEESMNKVNEVFGQSATVVTDWATNYARASGMSQNLALESAGSFGNLFTTMGMGTDEAANMSLEMVQLAADLSSFTNIPMDQVLRDMQSGLIGQAEPMRKYGVLLSENEVKAKALEMGLGGANGELTEQEKVLARNAIIMEQTTNAHGDFARTSDSLANSMRILGASFSDMGVRIGSVLIPFVTAAVGGIIDFLDTLHALGPGFETAVVSVGLLVAAIGPLLLGLGMVINAFTTVKAAMAGIQIAALLTNPIGLAVAALAAFGLAYKTNFLGFGDAVRRVGRWLGDAFSDIRDTIDTAIDRFRDMWDSFDDGEWVLRSVTGTFGTFTQYVWQAGNAINTVSRFLLSLSAALKSIGGDDTPAWIVSLTLVMDQLALTIDELVTAFDRWRAQGLNPVSAALAALGDVFPSITEMMWDVVGVVENLVAAFREFAAGNWSAGFDDLREAGQQAWSVMREGLDLIGSLATQLADWVVNVGAPAVIGSAQDIWDSVSSWVTDVAWPAVRSAAVSIGSAIVEIADYIVTQATSLGSKVWNWITDVAWPAVRGAAISLGSAIVEITDYIVTQATSLGSKVWNWITTVAWPAVQGVATDLWDATVRISSWAFANGASLWDAIKTWTADAWSRLSAFTVEWLDNVKVAIESWDIEIDSEKLKAAIDLAIKTWETGAAYEARITEWKAVLDQPSEVDTTGVQDNSWFENALDYVWDELEYEANFWVDLAEAQIRDPNSAFNKAGNALTIAAGTWDMLKTGTVNWEVLLGSPRLGGWSLAGAVAWFDENVGQPVERAWDDVTSALDFDFPDIDISWPEFSLSLDDIPFYTEIKSAVDSFVSWLKDPWPEGGISVSLPSISWPDISISIEDIPGYDGLMSTISELEQIISDPIGYARSRLGNNSGPEPTMVPPGPKAAGSGAITADWSGRDLLSSRGGLGKFSSDAFGGSTSITIPAPDFSAVITAVQTALQTITTAVTTHSAAWPVIIGSNAAAMAASASSAGAAMLAAMQASLQTVTVAVTTQTSAWATIIAANGAAMGASATSAGQAIVTALQAALQTATVAVTTQSRAWVTILTANGSAAQSATTSAFTAVRSSVQSNMQAAQSAATSAANSLRSGVSSAFSATQSSVVSSVTSLRSGVTSAMQSTSSAAIAAANSMRAGVTSAMATMASAAAAAVRNGMSQIPGIISSVGASAAATARAVGANIGNAMAAGMSSALGAIRSAANAMVAEAQRALTARAQIASPSKLFLSLGELVGEGFELGIRRMIPDVARATGDLVGVPALAGPYGGAVPYGAVGGGYVDRRTISITIGDIIQQPGEDGEALARRIGDATLERLHTALVSTGRR